jgi:hypothetical protein
MDQVSPGISIVCVFNDPALRAESLDRSLESASEPIETIYVDNSSGRFSTAGEALQHGALLSRHDVIAFAHQDVYLHTATALRDAAQLLRDDPELGMLGAVGVTRTRRVVGRVRDRWSILGATARRPIDVDSLDEVMFLVRRADVIQEPLTREAALAWHGYCVEYGLRRRALGQRVAAVDLHITHNSRAVNVSGLADAHRRLAELHPEAGTIQTTVGSIAASPPSRRRALRRWRGAVVQGREHLALLALSIMLGGGRAAIADIRREMDAVLAAADTAHALVVSTDRQGTPAGVSGLPRFGARVDYLLGGADELRAARGDDGHPQLRLGTNLRLRDVYSLRQYPSVFGGYHRDTGFWLLLDAPDGTLPAHWRASRSPERPTTRRPLRATPSSRPS